jgi:hypothetical protein
MVRVLLAGFLAFGASAALAAPRTAAPPPSGVVVHLFGPQGVWADLAPVVGGTPAAAAAPAPVGAPATVAPGTTVASAAAPAPVSGPPAPAPAPTAASYPEPTLGAILHQMFVTGDPDAGPGFAQGRKGN